MERLVDPIVADMQAEWMDARASGRHWRARLEHARGVASLLGALSAHVLLSVAHPTHASSDLHARPRAWRLMSTSLVTLLAASVAAEVAGAVWRYPIDALLTLVPAAVVVVPGALVAFALHRLQVFTTDPFGGVSTDAINFAHLRVAGVGGACLVIVSIAAALEHPLTTVALAAGLGGGIVWSLALIWMRRNDRPAIDGLGIRI